MRGCRGCGAPLPAPGVRQRNPRQWCSETCRVRSYGSYVYPSVKIVIRRCGWCAALFVARRRASVCSTECQRARKSAEQRERYANDPAAQRARVAAMRTDEVARDKERITRRAWRDRVGYTDSFRAADQRRRARKQQVPTENVVARIVFERDEWVCQICSEAVDSGLRYPDPGSASLDHRVPLALGGSHTYGNVGTAHLSCNVKRGARLEWSPTPGPRAVTR